MKPKKRYILVFLSCAFLAYCYFGGYRLESEQSMEVESLDTFHDDVQSVRTGSVAKRPKRITASRQSEAMQLCRMETCFDFSRCKQDFRIYIYPPDETVAISHSYQKLLNVVEESKYYTNDPARACLFLLSLDTLDRDHLSPDYVRNLQNRVQRLPHWNHGLNHVIFNLYSGTWPDYSENSLDFDAGMAILAKASVSVNKLRPGFDISIPLFHKNHPERGGEPGSVTNNNFPLNKNFLLAFKGKRYVYGIGSETRNALFHLHNEKDIIMVATCRHGKNWKDMKDERCDEDNKEYDRFDYEVLLQNSTFCLVPRGRRLGSYRFLEALQAGCIPVILSNGWALPFSHIINWNKAVIWADERLLLQVSNTVRSIPLTKILELRQQSQILWERYFSSVEKIVYTTLEIIRERLPTSTLPRDGTVWNNSPGGLLTLPNFSDSFFDFPFSHSTSVSSALMSKSMNDTLGYTAVIYCQMGNPVTPSSTLYRLISNIVKSTYAIKILIIWSSDKPPPARSRWPPLLRRRLTLNVITSTDPLKPSISQRFYPHQLIATQAILSLDEDTLLTKDEMDFAFQIWLQFPERIVGYPARSHYWDDTKGSWGYTSKWTNDYSIVLTGAAFYHRYYNFLYTEWLNPLLHKTVEQSQNCEDILMNFLVSHVTRRPPIKVTQRKQYKDPLVSSTSVTGPKVPSSSAFHLNSSPQQQQQPPPSSPWNDPDHFLQRQTCLNTFAAVFGYMPLLRSNVRLDPVLFKDPVSNLRKKYRKIELVGS